MVRDVKITVLKTSFNKELAEKFAGKDFGPCPQNYPGKVYISKGGLKPEGLCDDAWIPMERFVFAMAHGVKHFFDDWIQVPDVTVNCCNDGLRPVIFKCEAVNPPEAQKS